MATRVRRLLGAVFVAAICAASARATTTVICNAVMQNGTDFAQCSNGVVDSYTDPDHGVQEAGGGASAIANLRTGTLRSRSVAQAYQFGTYDLATSAGSIASLEDTITIGGGYSGAVQVRMEVSGAFLQNESNLPMGGTVAPPGLGAYLTAFDGAADLGTAGAFVNHYNNFSLPSGFDVRLEFPSTTAGGGITSNADPTSGIFSDPADVRLVLTASFFVTPSNPTFTVFARLGTHTAFSRFLPLADQLRVSDVDFGNSAHLALVLPEGVPWTSASGVFLSAVPEPGIGSLLALAALGLWARRARAL